MSDFLLKYSLLNKSAKQEINDFIDFLLSKKDVKNNFILSDYKKRILNVSTWTENDLKIFKENKDKFNQRRVEEW